MKTLITGATGKLGTLIVESILKKIPADQLAVSVRNPEKATKFKELGVNVRYGDFDKPETLDTAFAGIDKLLIISTFGDDETIMRQHTNAIAAAKRADVKFIVYTSLIKTDESNFFLAPLHLAREKAILETGISYSFLRNNWYLENELPSIKGAMNGAPWLTAAGEGKVGWILRQDLAEAAATVLTEEGHENTIYELSGKSLTQEDLVSTLGDVLGKEVPLLQVDEENYIDMMKAGKIPEAYLSMYINIQKGIREGGLESNSNDLERLIGRPATPIKDALKQYMSQV